MLPRALRRRERELAGASQERSQARKPGLKTQRQEQARKSGRGLGRMALPGQSSPWCRRWAALGPAQETPTPVGLAPVPALAQGHDSC